MIKVEKFNDGILLHKKVLFGGEPNEKYINLDIVKGEDIDYRELPYKLVNYPGEYDIDGVFIKCFVDQKNNLNYLVNFEDEGIGIIQNLKILDKAEVCNMDVWVYSDEKIGNKIDQLELEGDKILLSDILLELK